MMRLMLVAGLMLASSVALAGSTHIRVKPNNEPSRVPEPSSVNDVGSPERQRFVSPHSNACLSPGSLKEARAALDDDTWLKQLGCFYVRGAPIPAKLIDFIPGNNYGNDAIWQVRLTDLNLTVWVYASSLR